MDKRIIILLCIAVILLIGIFIFSWHSTSPVPVLKNNLPVAQITEKGNTDIIKISEPLSGAIIKSPLIVTGEARGNWYFEALFPVKLFDESGNQIAAVPAQAQGEWTTENFVPFTATLDFTVPTSTWGVLVLQNDNPSGMQEKADSISIPVLFR